jgi:aminopeptidase N
MDAPSLTMAEAAQRSALIDVTGYDVVVDFRGLVTGPEVRCTSTVRFASRTVAASTFADCAAQVVSARLNENPIPPASITDGRIPLTDLRDANVLVVESVQDQTSIGLGVQRVVDPADGGVYVWTSFEPEDCRHVWACFDQPDLKATHEFTVLAPAGWTVLSNSGNATVETSGGTTTWRFAPTPRLSTYNVVVNGGPLVEIRAERGGYDLGLFARASLRPLLERDADELFDLTARGLAFFGEQFAMPFPQRRYDQAFLPEFGGAMENYGSVTWTDDMLYRSPPTQQERITRALFLLHEMSHMWFGNIVTMKWWDDLWLNESFADLAAMWAAVDATEFTDMWVDHLANRKLQAYLVDDGPTSHPIRQDVPDVASAVGTLDAITYSKGASVLRQLMEYVGEATFVTGLRAYFAKHAWGNTTLDDLVSEVSAAHGQDLTEWSNGWLATAGADRLRLDRSTGGLTLVAEGPPGSHARPHALSVGGYQRGQEGLTRTSLVAVVVERGGPTELPGLASADLILVNDDDRTFATVVPDDESTQALLDGAPLLPTAMARAVAVATIWQLLTSNHVRTGDVVRALVGVIGHETSDAIVERFVGLAVDAASWWSPDADRDRLLADVADACLLLADQPSRRAVAVRGLAWTASTPEQLHALESAADTPDLRWRALVRFAELGEVDDAAIRTAEAEDPDPDVWVRSLTVRAARPDEVEKARAWEAVVAAPTVPVGSFGAVGRAFWRPGQAAVLRPFVRRFLDALPEVGRRGPIVALTTSRAMFPLTGIDSGFFDELASLLASDRVPPAVVTPAAARADEVRRMLVARGG